MLSVRLKLTLSPQGSLYWVGRPKGMLANFDSAGPRPNIKGNTQTRELNTRAQLYMKWPEKGTKCLGWEVDHSHPSRAEVKWKCSYTSFPLICLHTMDRDTFTILPLHLSICQYHPSFLSCFNFSGGCFTSFFHENPQHWFYLL